MLLLYVNTLPRFRSISSWWGKTAKMNADDVQLHESYEYEGVCLPNDVLRSTMDDLKTFHVRQDDVFVDSFPKSGRPTASCRTKVARLYKSLLTGLRLSVELPYHIYNHCVTDIQLISAPWQKIVKQYCVLKQLYKMGHRHSPNLNASQSHGSVRFSRFL